MKKILLDTNYQIDTPTLILQSKGGLVYGQINGETSLKYTRSLTNPNKITCTIPKYINGQIHHLWNSISDLKTIYIPEFEEKFQIKVTYNDGEIETKDIEGTALCEAELSQTYLRNFECNTDIDLEIHNYEVTKFYDPNNPHLSLLHRVLSEKASHYKIGYVANTLCNLSYEYTANEKTIYDFLTQDVAEQMQCLFIFDSMTRTISVYDLCSTCNDCYQEEIGKDVSTWKHYRDDFHDVCPNCGSTNIVEGFGKDTTILVDRENLANSIVSETDVDSLKNCIYVDGGDDLINAAFIMSNPCGGQYIYYFSDEMLAEMPKEFEIAYREYAEIYDSYYSSHVVNTSQTTHTFESGEMKVVEFNSNKPDSNYVSAYNSVVSHISNELKYSDYAAHAGNYTLIGQPSLVTAYYNGIDVEGFLQKEMCPTYEMDVYDKYTALSMLTKANLGDIAISGFESTTVKTVVENAILQTAKTIINTALFDVDVQSINYTRGASTWTGVFTIRDLKNEDSSTNTISNTNYNTIAQREGYKIPNDVAQLLNASVTLTINGDVTTYCKNRINYIISRSDLPVAVDLYELDSSKLSEEDFQSKIELYSIDNLNVLYNTMQSALDILQDKSLDSSTNSSIKQKLQDFEKIYTSRQAKIANRITILTGMISSVQKYSALMSAYIREIQSELDFKKFLEERSTDTLKLWDVFNYYRREGTYNNQNIISEGLETNAQRLQYAGYLMEFAKKEAIKLGTPQITITNSLNNLLTIKEFEKIVEDFEVGNWIRIRTDINDEDENDKIYKLRLLSYTIDFENNQEIDVEFSTVTQTWSGLRDAQNAIKTTQQLATSVSTVSKQVEKDAKTTKVVNSWVSDGFGLTNQQIKSEGVDQEIIIDEHGILARRDVGYGVYDPCQFKVFSNGAYLTTDNWQSIKTGIGKFIYLDPKKKFAPTIGYGVIADTIVSNIILSDEVGIYNEKGSMCFDEKGFIITNNKSGDAKNKFIVNPNDVEKLLKITKGENDIPVLYTDNNGNLNMVGIIDVAGGYIRGNLECLGTISGGGIIGSKIEGGTIDIGNGNFSVDADGNMITNNAQITGNINALNITANQKYRLYHGGVEIDFITSWISPAGLSLNAKIGTNNNCYICFVETQSFDINTGRRFQDLELKSDCIYMYGDVVAPHINGCCTTLANGGNTNSPMTFNWSGQLGQPEYVWGGNDGANMYVYKPSNFKVKKSIYLESSVNSETKMQYDCLLTNKGNFRPNTSATIGDDGIADVSTASGIMDLGTKDYRWGTIFCETGEIDLSDKNLKDNISPLTDKHIEFFTKLIPSSFTFKNGTSGRTHIGFISQDVESAMKECGLTDLDFAGFCKDVRSNVHIDENGNEIETPIYDENGNLEYCYSLRYSEFIALNTYVLQKTRSDLQETRSELSELKEELNKLKTFVQYKEGD